MPHKNPEQRAAYMKAWRQAHKQQISEQGRKYRNAPSNKNKEYLREYGITLDTYNQILQDQKECCAICGKHKSSFKSALSVDHCHQSGKVRGLLCQNCNSAIGKLNEDFRLLEIAKAYLLHYNNSIKVGASTVTWLP